MIPPPAEASVVVIIVNYKSAAFSINAVRSLQGSRDALPSLKVVVVENCSGDELALKEGLGPYVEQGWVRLILAPRNGGFAYGNNLAIRETLHSESKPNYYFLLNPDTEVRGDAIARLVAFMESAPKVGLTGCLLENADGSEWRWAFRFPNIFSELDNGLHLGVLAKLFSNKVLAVEMGDHPTRVDWLPGAAMLIRSEVFERAGMMDEEYFLYFEETDFCLAAARAGFECWYHPDARVMHIAGQSTGVTTPGVGHHRLPSYWFESRRRYFLKNHGLRYCLAADLAYIAGAALFNVRMKLQGRENHSPSHLVSDLLRHASILPQNRTVRPAHNY